MAFINCDTFNDEKERVNDKFKQLDSKDKEHDAEIEALKNKDKEHDARIKVFEDAKPEVLVNNNFSTVTKNADGTITKTFPIEFIWNKGDYSNYGIDFHTTLNNECFIFKSLINKHFYRIYRQGVAYIPLSVLEMSEIVRADVIPLNHPGETDESAYILDKSDRLAVALNYYANPCQKLGLAVVTVTGYGNTNALDFAQTDPENVGEDAICDTLNNGQIIDFEKLYYLQNQTCTLNQRFIASGTVQAGDNVIYSSGGQVNIPNSLPIGTQYSIIQTTDNDVFLTGNGLIAPLNSSLTLSGKNAVVTVLIQDANTIRIFGQTKAG